jgi:hypothetical protein
MTGDYECVGCGGSQDGLPFCFGPRAPEVYARIPENERAERVLLDSDLCIVDKKHFFIRGCLDIPIIGVKGIFRWLVWVSLSEANFQRTVELWDRVGREFEQPCFGWLGTSIPFYPDTLNLRTNVRTGPVGVRPSVELEPTDHALAREQREGVPLARAEYLSKRALAEWS